MAGNYDQRDSCPTTLLLRWKGESNTLSSGAAHSQAQDLHGDHPLALSSIDRHDKSIGNLGDVR